MNKPSPRTDKKHEFTRKIGSKAVNKLDSRKNEIRAIWFGLGTIGIIGWSVAVPTLIGIVQAYIFSVLAGVYIAAATRTISPTKAKSRQELATNQEKEV